MPGQKMRDEYIQVGNINTRYWALGDEKATTILIHGLGDHIEYWEANITALAQGRRVYALDLPGFGRTDKPHFRLSIPYFAEFVKEFMIVQGIDQADLIGESMGGAIALNFALKHPCMVDKMVLADSVGLGKEVEIFLRIGSLPVLGELFTRPSRKGAALLSRRLFYKQGFITEQMIENDYELASLPGAQRCLLSALRSMFNFWQVRNDVYRPILDHLEEINVPTLIIWGVEDRVLPVAHAYRAAKGLPNATLRIFERCGHAPNIELAEEFNMLVNDFLSKAQLAK